ncbi:MAG: site-specific integrase [Acidimicrobiales bacterium]
MTTTGTVEPGAVAGRPERPLGSVPTWFPARALQDTWPATRRSREDLVVRLGAAPFVPEQRATRAKVRSATGLGLALDWLEDQEGGTWQQRWLKSGAEEARAAWREVPTSWLAARGDRSRWHSGALVESVPVLIAADAIRPSLGWLVDGGAGRGSGVFVRAMAAARDPEGFSALGAACDADPSISATARSLVLYRSAQIMAAKGGRLADVCVGDVVEVIDALTEVHRPRNLGCALLYRLLAQMGTFGPDAPATLRALRVGGQRSPEELIDRYGLLCRPVRDLLVDYLRERQPALDYVSLEQLAYHLGKLFWSDLERHHPGIDNLRLSFEVADAWKRRLRTRSKMVTAPTGERVTLSVERISYQSCLTPVRAFYLDLAHWASEDPGRWGAWVAPCPIGEEEISQKKYLRQRKSRLDARTRERLAVLPVLQRRLAERHTAAHALLETARRVAPGAAFEADGVRLVRRLVDCQHRPSALWADDPCSGERRELVLEEEHAFWGFLAKSCGFRVVGACRRSSR